MHQPAVQVLLGDACCPGTHSTGASVAGWAETSFPSNLKGGKNGKERDIDIVPEHCTSGNPTLAMMVCSLKKCGNDAPSLQAAPASPGIPLAAHCSFSSWDLGAAAIPPSHESHWAALTFLFHSIMSQRPSFHMVQIYTSLLTAVKGS